MVSAKAVTDEMICAGWDEPGEWTEWCWRNEEVSGFHS